MNISENMHDTLSWQRYQLIRKIDTFLYEVLGLVHDSVTKM